MFYIINKINRKDAGTQGYFSATSVTAIAIETTALSALLPPRSLRLSASSFVFRVRLRSPTAEHAVGNAQGSCLQALRYLPKLCVLCVNFLSALCG